MNHAISGNLAYTVCRGLLAAYTQVRLACTCSARLAGRRTHQAPEDRPQHRQSDRQTDRPTGRVRARNGGGRRGERERAGQRGHALFMRGVEGVRLADGCPEGVHVCGPGVLALSGPVIRPAM